MSPGNLKPDINRVLGHHGGEWLRQPGETAQELTNRAIAAARLTTKGMPRLIAEEHHRAHAGKGAGFGLIMEPHQQANRTITCRPVAAP